MTEWQTDRQKVYYKLFGQQHGGGVMASLSVAWHDSVNQGGVRMNIYVWLRCEFQYIQLITPSNANSHRWTCTVGKPLDIVLNHICSLPRRGWWWWLERLLQLPDYGMGVGWVDRFDQSVQYKRIDYWPAGVLQANCNMVCLMTYRRFRRDDDQAGAGFCMAAARSGNKIQHMTIKLLLWL